LPGFILHNLRQKYAWQTWARATAIQPKKNHAVFISPFSTSKTAMLSMG
jgi:hypothetical protein